MAVKVGVEIAAAIIVLLVFNEVEKMMMMMVAIMNDNIIRNAVLVAVDGNCGMLMMKCRKLFVFWDAHSKQFFIFGGHRLYNF